MSNKELQKDRMVGYFIQATKELLMGEGLANATVRNIAEKAGYSNAVLYNYFKDVKELIFLCCQDFMQQCREFIEDQVPSELTGIAKLKSIMRAYTMYFVQYPVVFEIFYIEKISGLGRKQDTISEITSFLNDLLEPTWQDIIDLKIYDVQQIETIKPTLYSAISGMLLLYLNRQYPESFAEFNKALNQQLEWILRN